MRRLATLVVLYLTAAPSAHCQTRVGVVETGLTPTTFAPLPPSLTLGVVPQLVTLNLSAPSLSPTALVPTPALLAPAAPVALVLPSLLAAPSAPAALRSVKPAPYAPATLDDKSVPALLAPIRALIQQSAPDGIERLDDQRLLDMTRKLAGENVDDGKFSNAYLRPDQPLPFGRAESAAYYDVLGYGAGNASKAKAVVDASAVLLESAGVRFTRVSRTEGDRVEEGLRITPSRDGSPLNRLAWNLKRAHGANLEYAPGRLGYEAVATFNHELNTLFLPHFGRSNTYAAVLHEAHHSHYASRQAKGDLSPFHAAAFAKQGLLIVPRAAHYSQYASMEELTGHAKTLKHIILEIRRKPATTWWDAYAVDVEAMKLDDLSRSASALSDRILIELKKGADVLPLPADHWALAQLGPLPGGAWHSIMLPWCEFFIPVMDEAPAPRKTGLARLLSRKPETAGQKAARRTALALRGWLNEAWPAVGKLRAGLAEEPPDWKALDALAGALSLAGPKAEKAFKASR